LHNPKKCFTFAYVINQRKEYNMKKNTHTIVETAYGEVMVKSNGECYIGDNFDDYIGEINPKRNLERQIEKLLGE